MSIGIITHRPTDTFIPASEISMVSGAPLLSSGVGEDIIPDFEYATCVVFTKGRLAKTGALGFRARASGVGIRLWENADGNYLLKAANTRLDMGLDTGFTNGYWISASAIVSPFQLDAPSISDELVGTFDGGEKWYAVCTWWELTAVTPRVTAIILDPADGSVLGSEYDVGTLDRGQAPFTGSAQPVDASAHSVAYIGTAPILEDDHQDWNLKIGEISYWSAKKSLAELQAYVQKGFAEINLPTDLEFSWNFMRDWASDGDSSIVPDSSGKGNHGFIKRVSDRTRRFPTDNPVPVYLLFEATKEHDSYGIEVFTPSEGTASVGAWPAGTAQPSDADIFAGTGAVEHVTVQPDGLVNTEAFLTTLDTSTTYEIYSIQDELDGGTYSAVGHITITTPAKYSELIVDVTGISVGERTGIEWAWFDEEHPSQLSSAQAQGTTELTDATGLLEITLPTSITTPKGSKGTMLLKSNLNSEVQTAYHIVTVK